MDDVGIISGGVNSSSPAALLAALDRLGHPRLLVVGDLMLDRYTWGNTDRISPEAPVPILRADDQDDRLGGAAVVAQLLRGLEAEVTCAGMVGADAAGETVLRLLDESGIMRDNVLRDLGRPTTVKERFMGRSAGKYGQQILRVDREMCEPMSASQERQFCDALIGKVGSYDAVLISDYAKGVCTPAICRALIAAARLAGIPAIVDPARIADYSRYKGASLIKPNRAEGTLATGIQIANPGDAFEAAIKLCRDLDVQLAIVTLDRDGIACASRQGDLRLFETRSKSVCDITGAGDMVLAMIGLMLSGHASPTEAIHLANKAAGMEVERLGVAVIPRSAIRDALEADVSAFPQKILSLHDLVSRAECHRANGKQIVFTNGCFDLLHVGHAYCLRQAAELGDILIVGVNSDASVRRLKGKNRPIIGEADRAAMLAALADVDYVVLFDEDTPLELVRSIRPNVLVKGGAYSPQDIVGREIVEAYGGVVRVTSDINGVSTTRLLATMQDSLTDDGSRPFAAPFRAVSLND
jgi:D-beta-D-heptose 7-phosphate kinase/D-beta-D-heptose 1-phosphate adenosyltransferase